MAQRFSNYWKFDSEQTKQDVIATIQSSKLFLKHYKAYLERRVYELDKQITERSLFETINWTDKLAAIVGEMRGLKKEIELIDGFLQNTYD
jgi:hypothetical protein